MEKKRFLFRDPTMSDHVRGVTFLTDRGGRNLKKVRRRKKKKKPGIASELLLIHRVEKNPITLYEERFYGKIDREKRKNQNELAYCDRACQRRGER